MVIIWGTRTRREARGYGLHFCSICRELRWCAARAVIKAGHLYFVPLDSKHVLNELVCPTCGSIFARDVKTPLTSRDGPTPDPRESLRSLPRDESGPLLARIALEERVDRLSAEQRSDAIAEPLIALAYEHELSGKQHLMALLIVAMCSVFIVMGIARILMSVLGDPEIDAAHLAIGASVVVGVPIAIACWTAGRSAARRTHHSFVPRLARSLRPLSPDPEELEGTLAVLRGRGNPLALGTDATALRLALSSPGIPEEATTGRPCLGALAPPGVKPRPG